MRWSEFVDTVRDRGQYPTSGEAERVARLVLAALSELLTGRERAELAVHLPAEAALVVARESRPTRPVPAAQFVDALAARVPGATAATARWDVGTVFGVVAEAAGKAMIERITDRLPTGYGLLFGRAELSRPEAVPAA
ncbi:DUF2267 domain-containing protein [Streptomyces sp. TRM 70351]|uniref:DUF2267 domain-containing protein n=1 Tax=Streptomyces sp. TRM 70351 TaxID=3116552 RepID=UPI002E7C2BB9|nr:DUF2267 domain-containing protein [Streptomyces sp. TRM 70351]MEE1930073.1 DUF2267 domain-containing protein [Streptomyces sp. TRM 70351]